MQKYTATLEIKVKVLYENLNHAFRLVKEIGMKETGILVSCSDYHIFLKLKMTRRQAMEHSVVELTTAL